MNQYSDLDEISRDFLRELGNIGTGNAVTSLSHMLMEPVDIEVPGLQIMKYQDCCSLLPEAEELMTGIIVGGQGGTERIVFIPSGRDLYQGGSGHGFGGRGEKSSEPG